MNDQKYIPPQNVEAEMSLIGTILVQDKALLKIVDLLTPDDFYRDAHKEIFKAMLELFERNEPNDLVTVTSTLRDSGKLEKVGNTTYLFRLTDVIPFVGMLKHHAKIIKEKSILRKMIEVGNDIAASCYEPYDKIDDLVETAEQSLFEISERRGITGIVRAGTIVPNSMERLKALSKKGGDTTGVPTGFDELDKMTAGLQPADLVILAGRPSMGKSGLMMDLSRYASIAKKVPSLVFSLEMPCEQLVMRMKTAISGVDSQRIRTGDIHEDDWPKLTRAAEIISDAPIYIDDTAGITVLEMRAKARRAKLEHGIGIIFVDYLQLMQGRENKYENRTQEISLISRSLKAMAKELGVPVVALSQLNRSLEKRTDKRPQLSDLRDSGALEQDADVIIFVYRDEVYNKDENNPNKGWGELIVGKQRNGPLGTVQVGFLSQCSTFYNRDIRSKL